MSVFTKQLDKNYEEDLSKELEISCKVSKETKLFLEKISYIEKSNNESHSSLNEESKNEIYYKYDTWNKWTIKSKNISFKSNNSCGDGEQKLGYEYGIKPMGQNSSYDLDMPFNQK